MIRYDSKNWFIFLLKSRKTFSDGILLSTLIIGSFTAIICVLQFELKIINLKFPLTFHGLLGVVLGMLLVFRTNTAYDRWWEGRKLLGAMVNVSRFFSLTAINYAKKDPEAIKAILYLKIFLNAFKHHMLGEKTSVELEMIAKEDLETFKNVNHKPNYILKKMSESLVKLFDNKKINSEQLWLLQRSVGDLMDILGASERIKKTPIPYAYAIHLKRIVFFYVITLPFGLIHDLGWGSIPLVMFMFFTMVGIELIAEEIEDPFGRDANDLPFNEIVLTIEKNIDEFENS